MRTNRSAGSADAAPRVLLVAGDHGGPTADAVTADDASVDRLEGVGTVDVDELDAAGDRLASDGYDVVVGACRDDAEVRTLVAAVEAGDSTVPVVACVPPEFAGDALVAGATDVVPVQDGAIPWSLVGRRIASVTGSDGGQGPRGETGSEADPQTADSEFEVGDPAGTFRDPTAVAEALFESDRSFACTLSTDGRIRRVDGATVEVFDVDPAALPGELAWETPLGDRLSTDGATLRDRIRRAGAGESLEIEGDAAHGRVEAAVRPIRGEDGGVTGVLLEGRRLRSVDVEALQNRERALKDMYAITASGEYDVEATVEELLDVGRDFLGVDVGFLASVDPAAGEFDVVTALGDHELIEAGTSDDLSRTYCRKAIDEDGLLAVQDADAEGWTGDPAHERYGLACYLGGAVHVGDELYGTLCFGDTEARGRTFTDAEQTFVELLIQWVGNELEREAYDRDLRDARDRVENVLERIGDGFFAIDDDWRLTYLNDRAKGLVDVDESVVGESIWDVFPQAVGTTFETRYRRAMRTQEPVTFEEHFGPLDAWFEVSAYPDEDGLSVYFQDVTDRKERERRLERLVETTRNLMAAETPEEVMTVASDAAATVLEFGGTGIRRYDPDAETLEAVSMRSEVADLGERPVFDVDGTPHGDAFRRGETVVDAVDDGDPYDRDPFSQAMYVPIGDDGVLSVGTTDAEFDEADVKLAELLAASTEAALNHSERKETLVRYERVLETLAGMVYALDDEGRFTVVTRELADRMGYDPEEMLGEHVSMITAPGDVDRGEEAISTLLDGDGESRAYEAQLETADGDRVPVEVEISLLPFEDGEFQGSVGAVRDITELTRTRAELERERDRFTYLFDNLPDAVVEAELIDEEPIVRAVNPAFETTFGYDPGEVVGSSLNEFILPPELRSEGKSLDASVAEGEFSQREVRRRTASGDRHFLYRGVPYTEDGDARSGFAIYTDITDRKRREQYLQVISRVLRHNLRNDLNAVIGFTDYIAESIQDPQLVDFATRAAETASEIAETSEKAREIQHVIRSGLEDRRVVDVTSQVRDVVAEQRSADGDATIEADLPDPLLVEAGPRLADAIENLVENAVEHAGPAPNVRVTGRTAPDGTVEVRVEDDGSGIPEHERAVVTEDREISQLEHASGLGLWLVKWVVEEYGGGITFEESDADGTAVVMELRPGAVDDE